MREEKYDISGMHCAACSASVERVTRKLPGVERSDVNLTTGIMTICYDESQVGEAQIVAKVQKAGFGAALHAEKQEDVLPETLNNDDAELQRVQDNYPVMWKDPAAKPKLCFVGCPHMSMQQLKDWTVRVEEGLKASGNSKVLNIHTSNQMQVVLVKPDRFDNVSEIAEHLRSKHAVVLNLEATNKDIARRLVDFLSGCVYALDGDVKKIAQSAYLFCPHNMDVVGDLESVAGEIESYI